MDRINGWLTSERAVAVLGYVVGAVIGGIAGKGLMGPGEWLWAGVAVLCVVQLRLLAEPQAEIVAEEA